MNTIILGMIFSILVYSFIIFLYKMFNDNGIYAFGAVSFILANIQVLKTVSIYPGISTPLGNILFVSLLFCTKLLNKSWPFPIINTLVWIMSLILMHITFEYETFRGVEIDQAINILFKPGYYILFSSIISYFISQNIYIFLSKKLNMIPDFISTNITSIIDTIIFSYLFWIVFQKLDIEYLELFKEYMMIPIILRGILSYSHIYLLKLI